MQMGRNVGMQTLDSDMMRLVGEGVISLDDAGMYAEDKGRLNTYLERAQRTEVLPEEDVNPAQNIIDRFKNFSRQKYEVQHIEEQ